MVVYQSATLIAEVGTATTKLALVDLVDGTFRLLARAETASTLAPPEADATVAILQLAQTIAAITSRELIRYGQLLVPGDELGNGVADFAVTTSAVAPLRVVIAAVAAEQSAREAIQAARGTYSLVERVFALDEAGTASSTWFGKEVLALARARPDVVLIAGGLEGGAVWPLERLGKVAGLLVRSMNAHPHIIYAGNSAAVDAVRSAIGDGSELEVVDNLRPTASMNHLEPTRSVLRKCYAERRLPTLAGYETLKRWSAGRIGTVAEDQGLMLRFLAERFGRDVLALDIGATHSNGHLQADQHYSAAVLTDTGVGPGAVTLLETVGFEAIARWLPFDISEDELRNRLLNRLLQPYIVPADLEDLLLDHALLREALGATLGDLRAARPTMRYDLVIAGGAVARAPRPGLAALSLLDTVVGAGLPGQFAVDLFLDSLGLLAISGALAHLDPDAAACLMEHDGLNNGPLATVVVPQGEIQEGRPALEAELTPVQGDVQRVTVPGGQIMRLQLPRGQRGTLRIRPTARVRIGDNAPGAEVASEEAAIGGSALGVIIDARPRPLVFPEQAEDRHRLLRGWLAALDALPSGATMN